MGTLPNRPQFRPAHFTQFFFIHHSPMTSIPFSSALGQDPNLAGAVAGARPPRSPSPPPSPPLLLLPPWGREGGWDSGMEGRSLFTQQEGPHSHRLKSRPGTLNPRTRELGRALTAPLTPSYTIGPQHFYFLSDRSLQTYSHVSTPQPGKQSPKGSLGFSDSHF